jgi:hypothetical protein
VEELKKRMIKLSEYSKYDSSDRRGQWVIVNRSLSSQHSNRCLTESDRRAASVPLPEAIHLVELSERIKHETKTKSLQKEREKKTLALHSLGEKIGLAEAIEIKSVARKNYQEYFQTRQHAAVMIDEYLSLQDSLRDQQVNHLSVSLSPLSLSLSVSLCCLSL